MQTKISASNLLKLFKEKPKEILLLDVRTPVEYESEHIEGSFLHPLDKLNPEQVQDLMQDKKQCMIICRSGNRASMAQKKLESAGCPSTVLDGGIQSWINDGHAINKGESKVISLERQVRIVAGLLVVVGAVLGFFVNPLFIWLSGFVGAGLTFAGITDTCGMAMMLAKMPWNQSKYKGAKNCSVKLPANKTA